MFFGELLGNLEIDALIDRGKDVHHHQLGDEVIRLQVELLGEFLNNDRTADENGLLLQSRFGGGSGGRGRGGGKGLTNDLHLFIRQGTHVVLELHAMFVQLVQNFLAAAQAQLAR